MPDAPTDWQEVSRRALQAAYAVWQPFKITGKNGPIGNGVRKPPTLDDEALAISLELEKW